MFSIIQEKIGKRIGKRMYCIAEKILFFRLVFRIFDESNILDSEKVGWRYSCVQTGTSHSASAEHTESFAGSGERTKPIQEQDESSVPKINANRIWQLFVKS